jgi:hypothetical protein
MSKKEIKKVSKEEQFIDTVLGGIVELPKTADTKKPKIAKDDEQYKILKALGPMENEKITVKNKVTGTSVDIELVREGTTERALAIILLDKNKPQMQKDAMIAQYLFERGKESASFIGELFVYKGQHAKETHAFKRQVRFDFDMFADMYAQAMTDIANGIRVDLKAKLPMDEIMLSISNRFMSAGETIRKQRENVVKARQAERGGGIYIDKNGRAYSTNDPEVDEIIKKEREFELNN